MTKITTRPPRLYTYRLQHESGNVVVEYQFATTSMEKACILAMEQYGIQGTYRVRSNFAEIVDVNGDRIIDWRMVRV